MVLAFRRFVEPQLARVRSCRQAGILGDRVYEKLQDALERKAQFIGGGTMAHMAELAASSGNPFAVSLPDLLTSEERERALTDVQRRLDSGATTLPEPLAECLELQLRSTTDSFIEALGRLDVNRDAISDALLDGRRFHEICDVGFSVGDTHNHGRSVMVFHTDAGRLVYKPHDLRLDGLLHGFVGRFFGDFVGVPRSVAFGDDFGVCEFIEKHRAQGADEAVRFWRSLGGLALVAKLLGSTDLHFENILCDGTKPYVIDLETVLSPKSSEWANTQSAETRECLMRSLVSSLLMPSRINGVEMSVLINTGEDGISPIVDGKPVTVLPYLSAFKEGYRDAYARAVEQREAIREAALSFPPDVTGRVVLRNTRAYLLLLERLYHHSALKSQESRLRSLEELAALLREYSTTAEAARIDSEVEQMRRGDVPYFYARIGGLSLYADEKELLPGKFAISAVDSMLNTLDAMSEEDASFDLDFIDRAVGRYPHKTPKRGSRKSPCEHREAAEEPLSARTAAEEAKSIFEEMHALEIRAANGQLLWGYNAPKSGAFIFCGPGLHEGYTGLAVFACAVAAIWPDDRNRGRADALVGEVLGMCRSIEGLADGRPLALPVGEGTGLGGILAGLALMRRYGAAGDLDALGGRLLSILEGADFADYTNADRVGGLAGLVSALCRFEEYQGCTTAIRNAADRILELKTFAYRDRVLWKTLPGVSRAISGAGHGASGIAEALFSASRILGDEKYLPAAEDALGYELDAYRRYAGKFGTWADLRDFPPRHYMHGYCSGAPGTGIMLYRIMRQGYGGQTARVLASLARESVEELPLNYCDHLCCGNSAVAEYYLSTGDSKAAGRVLGAMFECKRRDGAYRCLSAGEGGNTDVTLFKGICGIGYEMLRYAYPQTIVSVL